MRAYLSCIFLAVFSCAVHGAPPDVSSDAPALMLALRAPADIDPAAYWVSEKLDGVRARWDGRSLRFRSGRLVRAPDWFVAALPAQPLDGELWLGRGRFDELSGLVRREPGQDEGWRAVRFMLFDVPGAPGDFTARIAHMQRIVAAAGVPWLQAVAQRRVPDRVALQALFERTVAAGGEGLMLHRADARWTAGRSDALLKLTPFLDAEAVVTAHIPGKGRHRGRLGSLQVRDDAGRRFRIGTGFSDAQRAAPPPVGSVVTYRYRELTAQGRPRFPVFLRVRDLP
ncbi:MAG: DNA ligase [Gammaproteobacteria bacterium]|nr:DNA ligase [Gammaproteobacteria bacterium]